MKIGYARVSTEEQSLDLQIDALRTFGCEEIFTDQGVSGSIVDRPGLEKMNEYLSNDDNVVVWKLDRLGRSLSHVISLIDDFGKQGVEFTSLTEQINTKSAGGRLIFHLMGALAEFERTLIVERTIAGMAVAKKRGIHLGRPRALNHQQIQYAMEEIERGSSQNAMAALLRVSRSTLHRSIERVVGSKVKLEKLE